MTSPAPSDLPFTSPSSSLASAGVAASRTGARAAVATPTTRAKKRVFTGGNLPNGRRQLLGEARDARVGQQLVQQNGPSVDVGHRQPPVRILVDGARHVRLVEVADSVAGRREDIATRGGGEKGMQRLHLVLLRRVHVCQDAGGDEVLEQLLAFGGP